MLRCPHCGTKNPQKSRYCTECGGDLARTGDDSTQTPVAPGTVFEGKYQVQSEIGRGGMGVVYRGKDLTLGRQVAIKVLPEQFNTEDEVIARFKKEARAMAMLDHPNVVPVYAIGQQRNFHYFVMKYLEGETVAEVLDRIRSTRVAPFSAAEVRRTITQVCHGLAHAHRRGLIHRDIKPGNIMLGPDGHVTIMDFGIVKEQTGEDQLTRTGLVFGTPEYMAPEQAQGLAPPGPRTDLYSVGIVAYEMLTGRPPFEGETPFSIVFKHIKEPPPPLVERVPGLSPVLQSIIFKAIAKIPETRYADLDELGRALEELDLGRHERELPAPAPLPTHVPRPPRGSEAFEPPPGSLGFDAAKMVGSPTSPPGDSLDFSFDALEYPDGGEGLERSASGPLAPDWYSESAEEDRAARLGQLVGSATPPPLIVPAETGPLGSVAPNHPLGVTAERGPVLGTSDRLRALAMPDAFGQPGRSSDRLPPLRDIAARNAGMDPGRGPAEPLRTSDRMAPIAAPDRSSDRLPSVVVDRQPPLRSSDRMAPIAAPDRSSDRLPSIMVASSDRLPPIVMGTSSERLSPLITPTERPRPSEPAPTQPPPRPNLHAEPTEPEAGLVFDRPVSRAPAERGLSETALRAAERRVPVAAARTGDALPDRPGHYRQLVTARPTLNAEPEVRSERRVQSARVEPRRNLTWLWVLLALVVGGAVTALVLRA